MNLEELQIEYHTVTDEKIVAGALIKTVLGIEDGMVFKDERTCKLKLLIIIAVDKSNKVCYGSLLVNTDPSPKAPFSPEYFATQYLLHRTECYESFLDYDSYVDCGKIFPIPIYKLKSGEYHGILEQEDKDAIWHILETTKVLTTKEKKRYGIKRL